MMVVLLCSELGHLNSYCKSRLFWCKLVRKVEFFVMLLFILFFL